MSYVKCPDCGKEIKIFGDSHIEQIADEFGYDLLAKMPIDTQMAASVDKGMIEQTNADYLAEAAKIIVQKCNK